MDWIEVLKAGLVGGLVGGILGAAFFVVVEKAFQKKLSSRSKQIIIWSCILVTYAVFKSI